jgi:hypothetical protein
MQPRRFDWKSTEDGARAHGAVRTAVCKRGCEPGRRMLGGAPQRPWEDHYPGGSRRPEESKPRRRVKGTWQSMSGPAGTPGPVQDAILSGRVGSTAEAQGDTTPEGKAAHQPLARAWSKQLEPRWVE